MNNETFDRVVQLIAVAVLAFAFGLWAGANYNYTVSGDYSRDLVKTQQVYGSFAICPLCKRPHEEKRAPKTGSRNISWEREG